MKSKKLQQRKQLFKILYDVWEFNNNQVKPHCVTGTRRINYKTMNLDNGVDKFGVDLQHLENILADTSGQTNKTLLSERREDSSWRQIIFF